MEEESKNIKLFTKILFKTIFFVIISCFEFIYLEFFMGKNFFDIIFIIFVKNVVLIMTVNLILLCVLHRLEIALIISCILFLIIGAANYFVISFRGYGIVYVDFFAVKTAATVAGGYKYKIDIYFILGLLGGVVSIILCFISRFVERKYFYKKKKTYFYKWHVIASLSGITIVALFIIWINFDAAFFRGVSSVTWDNSKGINDYGYVLYFVANAGVADVEKPDGYSVQRVDEILSAYEEDKYTKSMVKGISKEKANFKTKQNPNIIMIMNESYSDLRVLGDFTSNENVMSFYDSLKENTIKGYVQSSVYGGYTANSEFEFLTGCSKAFLAGNPYLQYVKDYMPSVISNIKAQDGYKEAIAIHPYNGSGYNRISVYPRLYFDKFYTIDDFDDAMLIRDYVSDLSDYRKIEELYENKEDKTSLCVFNVTMQNHNAYDYDGDDFVQDVKVTSFEAPMAANQYLTLMKKSDEALKQLITYFSNVDEPVIILLFGDHQPHLSDIFYVNVIGRDPLNFTHEDTMKKYKVPFMIWANYDIPEMVIDRTSINYLSSLLLDVAGLKMSNYNRYLMDLYDKLPAVSAVGYYDNEGDLYEISDKDSKSLEILKEYEMVQYNYLFDKENRLNEHYMVQ